MKNKIVVFGATGKQGGSVVEHLLQSNNYTLRAITRNKNSDKAKKIASMGCEVVEADLNKPETLYNAFNDVYGAFLVTNFWSPEGISDELTQGKNAVKAGKETGVKHFVWSTLPNCFEITKGNLQVPNYTQKAKVDKFVAESGFDYYTFTEAPMYFQNFASPQMAPQTLEDGSKAWMFPMDPEAKVMVCGDITEYGILVVEVFNKPELTGKGMRVSMSPGITSWEEICNTLNELGHNIKFIQVPDESFDNLPFPGAKEMREMINFWEKYSLLGPDFDAKITLGNSLVQEGFTSFLEWAKENMMP